MYVLVGVLLLLKHVHLEQLVLSRHGFGGLHLRCLPAFLHRYYLSAQFGMLFPSLFYGCLYEAVTIVGPAVALAFGHAFLLVKAH